VDKKIVDLSSEHSECDDTARKEKGCGIGYALAASSCEGANSMDACTVAAPDAITAFAVPNPNCSSQSQSVFSGLVAQRVASPSGSPSLLRIDDTRSQPFQPSTISYARRMESEKL
jgi:hypothetical protein